MDDVKGWRAYWKKQGYPWRTEPEINTERQLYLSERRAIQPDDQKGIYPFSGIKLSRADVEWLLAGHESKGIIGPIDPADDKQANRQGLDLRGANLAHTNLSHLPLAKLYAGASLQAWNIRCYEILWECQINPLANLRIIFIPVLLGRFSIFERLRSGSVNLEGSNLSGAQLHGAQFIYSDLTDTDLRGADSFKCNFGPSKDAGHGYCMSRIVIAYLLLVCGFATAYWSVGVHHPRDISFWTALIVSVTAFHGRVFTNPFAPNIPDVQVVITAIEAIVGLVIEGVSSPC